MPASSHVTDKELGDFRARVESLCARFPERKEVTLATRPLIVEVCGTPKAGKSTLAQYVAHLLRRCGLRISVIPERAELNPVPEKTDPSFNIWNLTSVLGEALRSLSGSQHVVLIDRGLLDCEAWLQWHHERGFVSREERDTVAQFIRFTRWWGLLDLVIAVQVSPPVALAREPFGNRLRPGPAKEAGPIPRVMRDDVLQQYNCALESLLADLGKRGRRPRIWRIDTSKTPLERAALMAAEEIVGTADAFVVEDLLVLRRADVPQELFCAGFRAGDNAVSEFVRAVDIQSFSVHRQSAEEHPLDYVQPIALGVITYQGKVLLLRRKEADERSYMHEKYVIWAGGHVRPQDKGDGTQETLERGLKRELIEEVQLSDVPDIRLIGLVYDTDMTRYLGHIGVVYEIPLVKEEAVLARSQTEFKERRGTGVSGTFVSTEDLAKYYDQMDEWSKHIVSALYGVQKKGREKQAILF